jgi:hypothetical protein
MSLFKPQILWDVVILTNHLIADASRLAMAQLITRLAIFLVALCLNRILPPPLAILIVTVFTILVVKWQTVGHMSDHGAVLDSALYFVYLITTTMEEWIQKKKLARENHRLTQENGVLMRDKEQLAQDKEQLAHDKEQLQHNTLFDKLRLPTVKLTIAVLILAVAGCALVTWWSSPAVAHHEPVHQKAVDFCNHNISENEKWEHIYGKGVPRTYRQFLDQGGCGPTPYSDAEELRYQSMMRRDVLETWEARRAESGCDSD